MKIFIKKSRQLFQGLKRANLNVMNKEKVRVVNQMCKGSRRWRSMTAWEELRFELTGP